MGVHLVRGAVLEHRVQLCRGGNPNRPQEDGRDCEQTSDLAVGNLIDSAIASIVIVPCPRKVNGTSDRLDFPFLLLLSDVGSAERGEGTYARTERIRR